MFLNELYEPHPRNTYFQTNMHYFQMMWPLSPWFIFSPSGVYFQIYFQSTLRSIYSESGTRSIFSPIYVIFSPWVRVVIASDLNGLFLEQYPHPPAIFSPICVIFSAFLEQMRFDFQSNGVLFLDQNQVLDPVLFGSLAIQRKLFLLFGWTLCAYFILYKSNKQKDDDSIYSLDGNVASIDCSHSNPRIQTKITTGSGNNALLPDAPGGS